MIMPITKKDGPTRLSDFNFWQNYENKYMQLKIKLQIRYNFPIWIFRDMMASTHVFIFQRIQTIQKIKVCVCV